MEISNEVLMKATHEDAKYVLSTLKSNNHEAYMAGGCVRDILLGLEPNDYDVTSSATPEEVRSIFPKTVAVGESFGVIKVICGDNRELDVATFRTDGQYSDNRRPDVVQYSRSAEEDVKRRDFTINAMLMDIDGKVIDYVGGQEDLKNKILRTVGSPFARFAEDSLRMMRAIRFSVRFGLKIDPETKSAIKSSASGIKTVSKERFTDEIIKSFAYGDCDRTFFLLKSLGIWHHWFDGHAIDGRDSWKVMIGLTAIEPGEPFILSLGLMVKESYYANEWYTHSLSLTNDQKNGVKNLLSHASEMLSFLRCPLRTQRRMMQWNDIPLVNRLLHCWEVAGLYSPNLITGETIETLLQRQAEVAAMGFPDALVNGNDLQEMGFIPGPLFADILTKIQDEQLEGTVGIGDNIRRFILHHFPFAPRTENGDLVDQMSFRRVIANCKHCGNNMSFEAEFNVRGKMITSTTRNPLGINTGYTFRHTIWAMCSKCSVRRMKKGFIVPANI
jgi:poly(A) polymerase